MKMLSRSDYRLMRSNGESWHGKCGFRKGCNTDWYYFVWRFLFKWNRKDEPNPLADVECKGAIQ